VHLHSRLQKAQLPRAITGASVRTGLASGLGPRSLDPPGGPLRVHGHLSAIYASIKRGANEAAEMRNAQLCSLGREFHEPCLIDS
jgi:hypothetical protein